MTVELIPSALARLLYYLTYSRAPGADRTFLRHRKIGAQALGFPEHHTILQQDNFFPSLGLNELKVNSSEYRQTISIVLVKNPHDKRPLKLLREDGTVQLLENHLAEPLKMGVPYNLEELYQAAKTAMDQAVPPKLQKEVKPEFSCEDLALLTAFGYQIELDTIAGLSLADQIEYYRKLIETMGEARDKLSRLTNFAHRLQCEFIHRRDLLTKADSVAKSTELDLDNLAPDYSGLCWD